MKSSQQQNDMVEIISTINIKGRVTIPAAVRNHLGIKTNDKIAFIIDSNGMVRIRVLHYPGIASLRGSAGSLNKPLSWDQIEQTAHEDHLEKQNETDQ